MADNQRQGGTSVRSDIKLGQPRMYNVVIYNDNFTTMDFVVLVLHTIFRMNLSDAYRVMLRIHRHGKGIAGTYPYDIAMSLAEKAVTLARQQGFPLRLECEPT